VLANEVRDALHLEEVRFVVAGEPWQKVGVRSVSPAEERLAMVNAAVRDIPGAEASDIEMRRSGPSYSVETLKDFKAAEPDNEFFLIVGADAAAALDTWESADELADLCEVVVVDRPGEVEPVSAGFRVTRVESPSMDLSSTALRERVAAGRSIRHMVPDADISIIESRGLYRGDQ
jgi:nicotinate-nucleotide adenylyltransferase